MSSEKKYQAEIQRPRLPLMILYLASLVGVVGTTVVTLLMHHYAMFQLANIAVLYAASVAMLRYPKKQRGEICVKDGTLLFENEPLLAQKNIALVMPKKTPANALLISQRGFRKLHGVTAVMQSAGDVRELVSDLHWNESQAAAEYKMQFGTSAAYRKKLKWVIFLPQLLVMPFVVLMVMKLVPSWSFGLTLSVLFAGLLAGVYRMYVAVRVGADGISLRRTFGGKRFIPYELIDSLERTEIDLRIRLTTGEAIAVSLGAEGGASAFSRKHLATVSMIDALFERIENARVLFSSRAEIRSHLLSALKRDGRSLEAWRLAATSLSHEHYRVAATPRDVLETIVQDSAVAPDVRIGAAIALHADAGMRIRVATETSALPELGAAIDAALDGDDPALEKAIATLKLTS